MTRLDEIAIIQHQKEADISECENPPLDAEGKTMAEDKRLTFDMPINVAKVDPLR